MKHISVHITEKPLKKERATERGEMMEYFRTKLNRERARDGLPELSMPRMGKILQLIPTKDLYYLKTVCDHAVNFSKKFWWELDPSKHPPSGKTLQRPPLKPLKKTVLKPSPRTRD